MPQMLADAWVPSRPTRRSRVSQTTGELRLRWNPFIHHQQLIAADRPAEGVQIPTRVRVGPTMASEYVSYRPPSSVGQGLLGREIRARIAAFTKACQDPDVVCAGLDDRVG
jgi:hypothetical protein